MYKLFLLNVVKKIYEQAKAYSGKDKLKIKLEIVVKAFAEVQILIELQKNPYAGVCEMPLQIPKK